MKLKIREKPPKNMLSWFENNKKNQLFHSLRQEFTFRKRCNDFTVEPPISFAFVEILEQAEFGYEIRVKCWTIHSQNSNLIIPMHKTQHIFTSQNTHNHSEISMLFLLFMYMFKLLTFFDDLLHRIPNVKYSFEKWIQRRKFTQ